MARRLPSLNGLKAFEAAARLESFTEAAQGLFVTHAAISRHIRELEEYLGTQLFTRTGRGVLLTEAGREFSSKLTPLFDQIADASRQAAAVGEARNLKVSVQPAIASRWLVSRFGSFSALHPDIELHIDPSNDLVDFHSDNVDLGLRYGRGNWNDVEAVRITDVVFFPVCSAKYLAAHPNLSAANLSGMNLLHEDKKEWWVEWLEFAGVQNPDASRGPFFLNQLALEAAEAGQGFALGDQLLCIDSLLDGWLVKPFTEDMKAQGAYWLVRRKGQRESGPMRAFREWLVGEVVDTNKKYQAYKGRGANSE